MAMRHSLFFIIASFLYLLAGAQMERLIGGNQKYIPRISLHYHQLGSDRIAIKLLQYGDRDDIVYINVHDDEYTSVEGTRDLLEKEGGLLIKIENSRKRNIRFRLDGKYYAFDPNRIFSRDGITQTLTSFGRISNKAIAEVEAFANKILSKIPDNAQWLIALHNNTNGYFSIKSYLPGKDRAADASLVFANPDHDEDNIFLTTDSLIYGHLADKQFNTILQDNVNVKRDGSLSVFCGERGIKYVNCETEHGKVHDYRLMMQEVYHYIKNEEQEYEVEIPVAPSPPVVLEFSYRLGSSFYTSLQAGEPLYFGDRKIGRIESFIPGPPEGEPNGKFSVDPSFSVYTNMDFFLFYKPDGSYKVELRVDPTRTGEPFPQDNAIVFTLIKES